MSERIEFGDGGYAFLKGGFPYSQGVVALPGYAVERAMFRQPLPLMQGFAAIEAHLAKMGRPRLALCAAELRSPKPFSFTGFGEFNRGYVDVLTQWNIVRAGLNPVARSNVAPALQPPSEPCFYAFSYTVPESAACPTFVISGSGESPENGRFPDDIVARGDTSPQGLRAKACCVLDAMQRRMQGLTLSWRDVTAKQVYCVHDIYPFLADEIVRRAGNAGGLILHYCRPPIEELEFEMDVRSVELERLI